MADRPEPRPSPAPDGLVLVESCTTTWAFDTARRRFTRLPRGLALSSSSADWRPYHSMHVDAGAGRVEVALDAAGTQLLRSEIHTEATCPHCDHPGGTAPYAERPGQDGNLPLAGGGDTNSEE